MTSKLTYLFFFILLIVSTLSEGGQLPRKGKGTGGEKPHHLTQTVSTYYNQPRAKNFWMEKWNEIQ